MRRGRVILTRSKSRRRDEPAVEQPLVNGVPMSHFGLPKNFDYEDIPASVDQSASNMYIRPTEVLSFLDEHPEFFTASGLINLHVLHDFFEYVEQETRFDVYVRANRSAPSFDNERFIMNEIRKMHATRSERGKNWIFPYLSDDDRVLNIPLREVHDLPIYIMLFILKRLTDFPYGTSTFSVAFRFTIKNESSPIYLMKNDEEKPIGVIRGEISVQNLERIYMILLRHFASLLPAGEEVNVAWNGSEESGTCILIALADASEKVKLSLIFYPAPATSLAHGWTTEVEQIITRAAGDTVISIRNRDDNKCLIYCLIIGLITKYERGGSRIFGMDRIMLEPAEVYSKGMYMFTGDDEISKLIRKLAHLLFPPAPHEKDPLVLFVDDLDKKAGTTMSMSEFNSAFREIEDKLLPNGICGVDVYGIDYNINAHVYPLYISKNRERILELLCVTPLTSGASHFCLIVNMEKLLKKSGGKFFFSCSKCGECFYHRRLLTDHKCPATQTHVTVEGEGGYHYSDKFADPNCDVVIGVCPKCRLCFVDEFPFEYHKKHCLMQGKTGYRHVQLVTYKTDEKPELTGVEIDIAKEKKHVEQRRVIYADFESSIDPESGEHHFMSYGLYDVLSDVYKCGYNLQEFIDTIVTLAYSNPQNNIYVYFHNAMGYDANFILRYIMKNSQYANWGIQVIMKSSNKLQKLVFHTRIDDKSKTIHIGDTFLFLTLSLERIVGSIRKDDIEMNKENFGHFFRIFRKRYPGVADAELDHILRKNIFPYKFFTDSSKLETSIEEFKAIFAPLEENLKYFSERVTLDDLRNGFEDTKHVIATFGCQKARDYHDLYLCCDVMQLADVFERSMKILWESHHIHLTKYLGMPSASWAAFLRYDPSMRIPLYEDTFYAEFFKGMIRGGITSAALRHAVADENHSIIYLDVNGLYPYVMQAYDFPCGNFEFMPFGWTGEMCAIRLKTYFELFEREHKGMCFCVDMHIPDEVKQLTDMYPFAPEHRRIYREYFSNPETKELTPFLKRWSDANDHEPMTEFNGLVCTLYDKKEYNVHWRLLKFYMEHGVQITKVYFGVMFDEGGYLKGYIRKNIEIRNTRKDELGKTLYKLLGNSIYGKTFESPFKRNTYEIVRDKVKLQGLINEGSIAAITPVDDLGWIVRMDGDDIVLDKPTYIGSCVCEFSKLHMYTLLYDKLMRIFPDNGGERGCQLVYTDTDSFIVRVLHPPGVGKDPHELFAYIKQCDPTLIGGIGGQVKSETGEDETIQEVIALRSKVYAYKTTTGHLGKRAKGTTYDAQEMQLNWDTYQQVLETLTSFNTENMQIARETFMLSSKTVIRQSLSANDGKRQILDDGIHTHAFGY